MYGARARIGLIVPSVNTVLEQEFNAMSPKEVSIHSTRLPFRSDIEGLKQMAAGVQEAAKLLASAGVNVIVYGCTAGSLVKGIGWDSELVNQIEAATGIPATTTATAVIKAFKELAVSKVAVATPYSEEFNQLEKQFFEAHAVKVVNMKGLEMRGEDLRRSLPETTYKLACEVNTSSADAVFISCTNFKAITVIEKLEEDLKKYVFSSNTASMWEVSKKLGITEQIKGYGKLFELGKH
jgi:maleate isomerase